MLHKDYIVDPTAPVAVTTLSSTSMAEELIQRKPYGLAFVNQTKDENVGVDFLVRNILNHPEIHFLLVTGVDSAGDASGETLLALAANGVDADGRVIGAPLHRPVVPHVTREEIRLFRERVQVVDLIGCEDFAQAAGRVAELAMSARQVHV